MSNPKTGIWAALGALAGGLAGAAAGRYAAEARPRYRYGYGEQQFRRGGPVGTEVEDAMVIGGASGAVVGAFIAGTIAGEEERVVAPNPQLPQ